MRSLFARMVLADGCLARVRQCFSSVLPIPYSSMSYACTAGEGTVWRSSTAAARGQELLRRSG